ncbi:hypothetical protein BX616_006614 [Lobosporangium transversale]|uniref:F-box domain-containing protein n=1 Tax=Lobosporangium transversale TaxID=64571 RepID=A0A1Y2GM77_9FUNG|nr:hypothetical protein BCR41DRAFT_353761 [Lobosporangium transversale]KAF9915230.1 hypothetical protein BX616_006614 [Lobosporangium transversale]ORZ15449.1 hypothetical protein BCR41DRAFT_353761 [Lobosporangium transversale]|eukprot:XP_021881197.1 hypothetical protein BCR41DRAFT_353761 [Lobosporangium transversale]
MDAVVDYHRRRIKALLRTTQVPNTDAGSHVDHVVAAIRTFRIPELCRLILECTPKRYWTILCLVSKDFLQGVQPLIWKALSCNKRTDVEKIHLHVYKYAELVKVLDLSDLRQPELSMMLQPFLEVAVYRVLGIVSLKLHDTELTTPQLVHILVYLPSLRTIDITACLLDQHPLNILSRNIHLESIAFTHDIMQPHGKELEADIFQTWKNLRHLSIKGSASNETMTSNIFFQERLHTASLHLISLKLAEMNGWTHSMLARVLQNGQMLTRLCLAECDVQGGSLVSLSSHLGALQTLEIKNCPRIYSAHCTSLLKACPRIRHVDFSMQSLGSDIFYHLARNAPALTSLILRGCAFKAVDLKQVMDHCAHLQRLVIEVLPGVGLLGDLFGGQSWGCLDIQEIFISSVRWPPFSFTAEHSKAVALMNMWTMISKLRHLRILSLTDIGGEPRFSMNDGLSQLAKLEKLALTDIGPWKYTDVLLIAEAFPWLEEFRYSARDMSTDLWAWFKRNRPDVKLIGDPLPKRCRLETPVNHHH